MPLPPDTPPPGDVLPAWLVDTLPQPTQSTSEDAALRDVLRQRLALAARVEKAEAWLKEAKNELRRLDENELPGMLDALGMSAVIIDGVLVALTQFVTVTLTNAEKRNAAIAWLRQHGHDGIVSTVVSVGFGKGEQDAVGLCAEALRTKGFQPELNEQVNTGTFKALLKEAMAQGMEIPGDEAGVFVVRKVLVK